MDIPGYAAGGRTVGFRWRHRADAWSKPKLLRTLRVLRLTMLR
jgi:hypothetical protein